MFFVFLVILLNLVILLWLLVLLLIAIRELVQFECCSILLPDIIYSCQTTQIVNQVEHFFIIRVIIKWNDWYSVVYLKSKWVDGIVHDYQIIEVSVSNYSQVFYIVSLLCQNAMLSVHSVLDQFMIGVNVVEYRICVSLVTGSKDYDLEVLIGFFQTLHYIRSNVYPCLN